MAAATSICPLLICPLLIRPLLKARSADCDGGR